MSDPSLWWARIKYIENFEDYVPVCELYECDENMQKTKPFRPQHLDDFKPEKYYLVQTNKFNNFRSKKNDIYYALVGYLVESKRSIINDTESKECQWPASLEGSFKPKIGCDICQDIEEDGSKNIRKKCKTSRMCCQFDKKILYPLLSLITQLKKDSEATETSIEKLFLQVMNCYRAVKKRLFTDLYIYVPRQVDLHLSRPSLKLAFIDFFSVIEKWNDKLKLKFNSLSDKLKEVFCQIDNLQTGTTSLPITALVLVRLLHRRLMSLELALVRFYRFLVCVKIKVLEVEEQLEIWTMDIENIGIEIEMAFTVFLHYASAILESLSELEELIINDIDTVSSSN